MKKTNTILLISLLTLVTLSLSGCFLLDIPLSPTQRISQFEDDLNASSRDVWALRADCSPYASDYSSMLLSSYWETAFDSAYIYDFYNITYNSSLDRYDVTVSFTSGGITNTNPAYFKMDVEEDGNYLILEYTENGTTLVQNIK